jgi:hypothetical protein
MRIHNFLRTAARAAIFFWLTTNGAVVADDLFPAPWRGQPRTTLAEWDFVTAANPTPPDGTLTTVVGDSGGVPMAEMESDLVWDPVFNGSWHTRPEPPPLINTFVYLEIPNWIDQEPLKLIQIQITAQPRFTGPGIIEMPFVVDVGGISGGTGAGHTSQRINFSELEIDPVDGIWHRTETWQIRPNPDQEVITLDIPQDSLLTQIVVDTISFVPEPGTMILVGVAMASLGTVRGRARLRPRA